jgi:Subtilase family
MKPMIMRRVFLSVLPLVLAVTACDASEESQAEATLRSTPSDEELEDMMCSSQHQIALRSVGANACPNVDGWQDTPVFDGATGILGRFCRYDWIGQPALEPDVDLLDGTIGISKTASDCGVALSQGVPTDDAVWTEVGGAVEAAFHHGIGRASASDLNLSESEASRWKVTVAVVDSVPEPKPALPRSQHGELMVSLINDIACPAGLLACDVDVVRELGLPRYGNGLGDFVRGGYYGTQADVAKAIYDAVESWRSTSGSENQAEPSKLIINLSVGWEGNLYGDVDDPTPRPSVEAVHAAIEWAACHGALVIAAAGNRGYTCETGPLLPGAWETHPAPNNLRCQELGAPNPPASVGYKPLLYSIGGLSHDRRPMQGTREDGMPRLAALATNAVAAGDGTTITGTSASTAAASGAAALVWSYNPQLTPSAVMNILYQSGAPTPLSANYYLAGALNTDVRAINACRAVEAACNLPSATCPTAPFASPLACIGGPPPVSVAAVLDELELSYDDYTNPTVIGDDIECESECGTPSFAFIADPSMPAACPEPSSQQMPFALPQPTQIGCPNCTLDLTWKAVYASIDPAYATLPITDVTVSLFDGVATTYFRFGALPLYVDRITKLQLDTLAAPATIQSATIAITFGTRPPVVDPLLLGP